MYDEPHFTRDAAVAEFDTDAAGIERTEDGDVTIDWDEVETVVVDNPPHAQAFDSKEFFRLPATVARPIPQPYQYGEDTVWLKKPREELKKAAWSLDNAPWTMGHPDTGMVKDVDDVRGFWDDTQYIDGLDDLDSHLHIPVDDDEAKSFVEENGDVSVGFYNRVARTDEYDGVVGGADEVPDVDVEGYQTDMMFDHCASVSVGRCPSGAGCGIDAQAHGHMDTVPEDVFKWGTSITDGNEDARSSDGTVSMQQTTDQPDGIYEADGTWFAVAPDEHPDETTEWPDDAKFPVDSCADIEDAWRLRGTGDISIEESTLESRIKRAAEAKGCDVPDSNSDAAIAASAKRYSICGERMGVMTDRSYVSDDGEFVGTETDDETETQDQNMTDDNGIDFNFDDLSTEAALAKIEEEHDGVSERLDELRASTDAAEAAREAADELDVDVDELADAVALKDERIEELESKVDELQRPQMEDDAKFIAEHTDRYGDTAEEVMEELDEDPEAVADKRELVEDLVEGYDEMTANSGDGGGSGGDNGDSGPSGRYARKPEGW